MAKYFFDITDIVLYVEKETSISGIQRVSFEVIKRMVDRHGVENVRLSYWDRAKREYVSLPSDFLVEMPEFDPYLLSAVFFGKDARPRVTTAPTLERYRNKPLKYRFHYMKRWYHALRQNEAHFRKRRSSLEAWRDFHKRPQAEEEHEARNVAPTLVSKITGPGDRLIVLGATWAIDGLDDCLQNLKDEHGMDISQLIHDLIPIITPEHIAGDFSHEFYRWLEASTGYCSAYYANSANTAKDLQNFMEEIGAIRPIHTIPLAQEFTVSSRQDKPEAESVASPDPSSYKYRVEQSRTLRREILNLSKVPFVLVVGTMESRKNIWRLLQVWQRLIQDEGIDLPKLVFAGKPGWYNDDFNQLIKASGNLGGWVQFAHRPTDVELAYLYENCVFTAMVSFYEGWGLPIGEGLSFGKTAVVANNSSMPEVGGDMVEYCDAHSIDSIYAACYKLISTPENRLVLEEKIASQSLRTWNNVTSDFVDALSA